MDSENGIFFSLLAIAALFLLVAVGYIAMQNMALYDTLFIAG